MRIPSESPNITGAALYRSVDTIVPGRGITPSACVSATVSGGKACLTLPIINKSVCLPAPGVPNLGSASVCCNAKLWPPGVKCCLKFGGRDIYCKSFGF
jgi:hypothetical protein